MFKTPKGELVIDFGQNFTGYINVKIKGNRNKKITLLNSNDCRFSNSVKNCRIQYKFS